MNHIGLSPYRRGYLYAIRFSALGAGVVALFCIVLSGMLWYEKQQIDIQLQSSRQRAAAYRNGLDERRQSERMLQQGRDAYQRLKDRQAFQAIDHLTYIDAMDRIVRERGIPFFHYEFPDKDPDSTVPGASRSGSNNAVYWETIRQPVHIEMELLHEDDLINFFADLNQRPGGLFDIRRCNISRDRSKDRLMAGCVLDRVTLSLKPPRFPENHDHE